jgi:hypothetical protein
MLQCRITITRHNPFHDRSIKLVNGMKRSTYASGLPVQKGTGTFQYLIRNIGLSSGFDFRRS